jgi:ribosome-binding protein aMBF1 (putative translation factor)
VDVHEFINKRKNAGFRQDDFAARIGWSWGTVVDIERGRVPITSDGVERMDQVLTEMIDEREQAQTKDREKEVAV